MKNKLKSEILLLISFMLIGLVIGYWLGGIICPNSLANGIDSKTDATYLESSTNDILNPITKMFCPVCKEKGLKSSVYEGLTLGTLLWNYPYYDEEGNYHYENPNTYTTEYSCSLGHEWTESYGSGTGCIRITKDTENKIIKYEGLDTGDNITGGEEGFWFAEADNDLTISSISTTSIIFGDDVGKLSWEDGIIKFEGNADESARIFFEEFLIPYMDEYIKSKKEDSTILLCPEPKIPEVNLIEFTTGGVLWEDLKPVNFIKVTNTNLAGCLKDNRLRLNLNGKIYWIRLEEDKNE